MRVLILAIGTGLSMLVGRPFDNADPTPACLLLKAKEASQLLGMTTIVNQRDSLRLGFSCRFNPTNPNPLSGNGVEITTRQFDNAQDAHGYFPRWVMPVPGNSPGITLIQIQGIGDEATLKHGAVSNSILFRSGAVLVKMGTRPGAGDSALTTAARLILGRL